MQLSGSSSVMLAGPRSREPKAAFTLRWKGVKPGQIAVLLADMCHRVTILPGRLEHALVALANPSSVHPYGSAW